MRRAFTGRTGQTVAGICLRIAALTAVSILGEAEGNTGGKQNSGAKGQDFIFHLVEF